MKNEYRELFEEYSRGRIDRREFFRRLAVLAGGAASAAGLLSVLEGTRSYAQVIPMDDSRLDAGMITYPAGDIPMKAYQARPKREGRFPGVIVIHENRGLVPHIKDVARRVALEGYVAVAPDALSPFGGTPADSNEARPLFQKLESAANIKNFTAAVAYLKTHPRSTGKVGCMGFCWGGGVTNQVAVNAPDLNAAAPFYGSQPALEDVPKIKASMLLHYAGEDARINAGIPAYEEALKKAGVEFKTYMYEGAGHAFFNDTGTRYNKEASALAWERTLAFFKDKLGG
ncbi:MAG: dienelactone hydrolase family protein [Candidatus Aminicenantes bacterium]|nr:dienelactone hydrolase family protein [Candidatus Aminicenantes bacterium]